MELDLYKILTDNPVLLLFIIIGFGYLIGKINFKGFEVGHITGVLLVSLFCGALGFQEYPQAATLGFTLFIFCVGLQAGPSFLSVFLQDGSRYFMLSIVVVGSALLSAFAFTKLFNLDLGFGAGILAGALTSTPTLVGAQDAISQGLVAIDGGLNKGDILQNLGVAYSVTYLLGMVGLIFIVKFAPKILGFDLVKEAQKAAPRNRNQRASVNENNLPIIRAYVVGKEDAVGKTIGEIQKNVNIAFTVLALKRDNEIIFPDAQTVVNEGDIASIIASVGQHAIAKSKGIEEVFDKALLNFRIRQEEIVVTSQNVVGSPLKDVKLPVFHACYPIGLTRAGIELPANDTTILEKGDVLHVMGEEQRIKSLGAEIGTMEADAQNTDLLTLSMGIAFGLILGTFILKFGNVSIGLGSAGGLLLARLSIGFVRSVYPTFGRFPPPARNLLMEFGIVLFMASIGLQAGDGILDALADTGLILIGCGVVITLFTFFFSYAFGRYVLKINPALLLGAIAGAMTSTPALQVLTDAAKSNAPALGYAGTYTFANVFLTFCGMLLMTL